MSFDHYSPVEDSDEFSNILRSKYNKGVSLKESACRLTWEGPITVEEINIIFLKEVTPLEDLDFNTAMQKGNSVYHVTVGTA